MRMTNKIMQNNSLYNINNNKLLHVAEAELFLTGKERDHLKNLSALFHTYIHTGPGSGSGKPGEISEFLYVGVQDDPDADRGL